MSSGTNYQVNFVYNLKDNVSAAAKGVKKAVGDIDTATKETSKQMGAFQSAMSVAAGVIISDLVGSLGKAASASLELGAKSQSLQSSFDAMKTSVGATNLTLEELRTATKGTVSDVDLLTSANKAMSLGLPTDDLGGLMEAAMKLGRVMGIDTLNAVDSLTTGIGRQSAMILDNLGVTFKAEEAYTYYAEKLGVTTNELDENQKKLAWQEYAMYMVQQRAEALGPIQDDMITQQEQMAASQKNLNASIGEAFAPLGFLKDYMDDIVKIGTAIAMAVIPQWIEANGGLMGSANAVITKLGSMKTAIQGVTLSSLAMWAAVAGIFTAGAYAAYEKGVQNVEQQIVGAVPGLPVTPRTIFGQEIPSLGLNPGNALLPGKQGGGWVGMSGPEIVKVGESGPEYVVPNHALGAVGNTVVTNNKTMIYDIDINVKGSMDRTVMTIVKSQLERVIIKASSSEAPEESKTVQLSSVYTPVSPKHDVKKIG